MTLGDLKYCIYQPQDCHEALRENPVPSLGVKSLQRLDTNLTGSPTNKFVGSFITEIAESDWPDANWRDDQITG